MSRQVNKVKDRIIQFSVLTSICRFKEGTKCYYFGYPKTHFSKVITNYCIKAKCPLWHPDYKPKDVCKNSEL